MKSRNRCSGTKRYVRASITIADLVAGRRFSRREICEGPLPASRVFVCLVKDVAGFALAALSACWICVRVPFNPLIFPKICARVRLADFAKLRFAR